MSLTLMNQLGVIPAILIGMAGILVIRNQEPEHAARRLVFVLLWSGVVLLSSLLITRHFFTEPHHMQFFELSRVLSPSLLGITALILLNLKSLSHMSQRARITAILLGLGIMVLVGFIWDNHLAVEFLLMLPGALILAIAWTLGRRYGWLAVSLIVFCFGILGIFNYLMNHPPDYTAGPPPLVIRLIYLFGFNVWPVLGVAMSGLMLAAGLQPSILRTEDMCLFRSRRGRLITIGLASLLILYLAYITFWGSVWDQTSDGLFGLFISQQSALIAIGTGMIMTLALRGRPRLTGIFFTLVVPLLFYQSFEAGWDASYHDITEKRADRIASALEKFRAREGRYPGSLEALTPSDLLYIQQPMILAGEEWCYQGDEDAYRLAAYYREYFSLPVSLRVYASAGEPPAGTWDCEGRLAEIKARYDPPPFVGIPETAPTPVPLPTSVTTTQRITIQPILQARTIFIGKWSQDGMFLVIGLPEISGNQSVTGLAFLKADTGEVCPIGDAQWETGFDDGVREHFAWLPDGRLLYVPSSGDITLLSPCEPDSVALTDSYPVAFTHALDYHESSGRVLLKNQDSFWILDGNTMEALQIPDVKPNPFEAHWDHFAWSPDGRRLAISRLNGQTAKDGSTLFIVNAATGEVEHELPLDIASDQSAPMVEWMSEDELLLHGNRALFLIDFRTDPPNFTDVMRDIFLLDISYPDDISTFAWEGHHLSIRVNHPRNQGIYIFHPETGQVEIIQPKSASPLFFFPNGEMVEMANFISDPPAEDVYELIWVDAPDIPSQIITVQGHLPRIYPSLFPRYLPETSQLSFSSSQGVSLVSIPDGETLGFWELAGGGGYSSYVVPPSAYPALVLVAEGDGLYYIPLP